MSMVLESGDLWLRRDSEERDTQLGRQSQCGASKTRGNLERKETAKSSSTVIFRSKWRLETASEKDKS